MCNEKKNIEEEKIVLSKKFATERKAWRIKMKNLTSNMNDMNTLSDVLIDALSSRQIALEYTHIIMSKLSIINAELRKKKKSKFLFYSQDYDIVLQKEQKNLFIDVDLEEYVVKQELLAVHLSYMRGTVDSIDKLIFGIKWRIQIKDYES